MFGYFLLSILRNLVRNKLHSLINIASLALGLAVFSFAFLYVKQETSYDRSWPEAERIHRVIAEQNGIPGRRDGASDDLLARNYPLLLQNFPDQIDKATRLYNTSVKPAGDESGKSFNTLTMVDQSFADIFKLEVVSGSIAAALQEPGFIAMEESVAATLPGTVQVGSRLLLESTYTYIVNGKTAPPGQAEYQVAAIFRAPKSTSSPDSFRILTLMHDYSLQLLPKTVVVTAWNDSHRIWLRLKPGVELAQFQALMPAFIDKAVTAYDKNLKPGEHISEHLKWRIQPVTDLHFHPIGFEVGGDATRVLTIAVVGLLVLLVGCSNSISLSLATVLERRREIGIRKAVGALQHDILLHYLLEAVLLALLALAPAIALVELLLPPFATLLNIRQQLEPELADLLVLILIATMVGLLSGAYPALVLSKVKPQLVLKLNNGHGIKGTQSVRTLLVGFQFCFALMLMIATLALYLQLSVVRKQPLGFDPHNLVYLAGSQRQEASSAVGLRAELRKIPGVRYAIPAPTLPGSSLPVGANSLKFSSKNQDNNEVNVQMSFADPDHFFSMLQIPVLAGREFDAERDWQDPQNGKFKDQDAVAPAVGRVVFNRAAIRAFGFDSPEAAANQLVYASFSDAKGKLSKAPYLVLGVVEDSMYQSLRRKPGPEVFMPLSAPGSNVFMLKLDDAANETVQQEIKKVWLQVTGASLQTMLFIEPRLAATFAVEQNESRLLLYCGGLALFLSCIGLYGLAAFTMERRTKEVGVRKVMGASVSSITALFLWRYARPVLLATIIASPIAVYFVLQWMERFPYQMDKLLLLPICLTAGAVVLLIALLTVAGIVLKAARARPVKSLRYE